MTNEQLWVEKYRPKTVRDCILPSSLKSEFQSHVGKGYVPNLILTGSAGVGKTTIARAMLNECGFDYIVINGSLNGNIDTLRTDILNFASTVSLEDKRKYVILDEADYLSANTQAALRNFMEEFSGNCGFVLTCNFQNRIIEPLHSRCAIIDFKIQKQHKQEVGKQFLKRCCDILDAENTDYDKKVVAKVIAKHFPDNRRIINELQAYSVTGKIDDGILINFNEDNFKALIKTLKEKNFKEMRKWVGENSDVEPATIYKRFYDSASQIVEETSEPQMILHLHDYQYKSAFVADPELNLVACMTELMCDCEWR